jgi:hypothetical protein
MHILVTTQEWFYEIRKTTVQNLRSRRSESGWA